MSSILKVSGRAMAPSWFDGPRWGHHGLCTTGH